RHRSLPRDCVRSARPGGLADRRGPEPRSRGGRHRGDPGRVYANSPWRPACRRGISNGARRGGRPVIPTESVKVLLVAMFAIGIGCSGKSAKAPPPEDAPAGDGGPEPVEVAGQYDRKCVGGDLEACRNLGVMYAEGMGVSPDPRRATALFS